MDRLVPGAYYIHVSVVRDEDLDGDAVRHYGEQIQGDEQAQLYEGLVVCESALRAVGPRGGQLLNEKHDNPRA